MPTNAINPETINVCINFTRPERALLGRLAFDDNCSVGEYVRRLYLVGVRTTNAPAAAAISKIRTNHRERPQARAALDKTSMSKLLDVLVDREWDRLNPSMEKAVAA